MRKCSKKIIQRKVYTVLDNIFGGLFDSATQSVISVSDFLLCLAVALLAGAFLAAIYAASSRHTSSFLITLGILPAVVCVVIMMVNGNVGAGVAVAGAFSLVRFRSMPGTAKEITALFLAMASGLIAGMGYLAYSVLFTVLIGGALVLASRVRFPAKKGGAAERTLRITVPEDLDYVGLFDEVFEKYATEYKVISVKTTNMGSLFKLTYNLTEKDVKNEKQMIDELRLRNGNLEIAVSEREVKNDEL